MDKEGLQEHATRLRIASIEATNASKSGHPTTCSSMAEIMSVLFFDTMRYTTKSPRDPASDRLILSKGHAAPILYAAWKEAGYDMPDSLDRIRKLDSDLEGHPTPRLDFVDVATGSLGQGLSVAAGMAYMGKYIDKSDFRTYCILGDGESAEGAVWEAMNFASYYKLDNLCAIFDINRLGQSEPTALQHNLDVYAARAEAFGFEAIVVDGHDVLALRSAFEKAASTKGRPQAILAKTFKGKDFPDIEDKDNWHGKPLGEKGDAIIKDLEKGLHIIRQFETKFRPPALPVVDLSAVHLCEPPNYKMGEKIATRQAYGTSLVKLGKVNSRVIALDGDTKNSTFSETYKKAFPDRYIECFIAEQNLVGVAIGVGCRKRAIPFVSTFACFLSRAYDQLRMAAISRANLKCVGSHCGVSIGEDGPSQMALEDIAMFRAIPDCRVFYPCDAVSMERATELAAQHVGMDFIRTSRPATPVIYSNDTKFAVGKAQIVLKHDNDKCLIIGAGVTLHEALKAAETVESTWGINVRVMDPFTIKPIDDGAIRAHAKECNNKIVVVEDHYPEGGLGEAVASVIASESNIVMRHLAVREVPRSGPPQALLDKYRIDANAIVEVIKKFI